MDEDLNVWFVSQQDAKVCRMSNPNALRDGLLAFLAAGNVVEEVASGADGIDAPVDLSFHPNATPPQLWVLNQVEATEARLSAPQGGDDFQVRDRMAGSYFLIIDMVGDRYDMKVAEDAFSTHFMTNAAAFAFTMTPLDDPLHSGYTFATAQADGDFRLGTNGDFHLMGLTLWSADLAVFGNTQKYSVGHTNDDEVKHHGSGATSLGSHLDMLHEAAYLQGVAWEDDYVFWAHQGFHSSETIPEERHGGGYLLRYDFKGTHGPGGTHHSDGIIRRFRVMMPENLDTPAHMEVDERRRYLYACSPKEGKVLAVNIATRQKVQDYSSPLESVVEYSLNDVAHDYVIEGLTRPIGIAMVGPYLLISDENAIKLFRVAPVFEQVERNGDEIVIIGEYLGSNLPWQDVRVVYAGTTSPLETELERMADGKDRLVFSADLSSQVLLWVGGRAVQRVEVSTDGRVVLEDAAPFDAAPSDVAPDVAPDAAPSDAAPSDAVLSSAREAPFAVYPNPASQALYLSGLPKNLRVMVAVYGLGGQRLLTETIVSGDALALDGLPQGTYFLLASFAGDTRTAYFVKR